MARPTSIEGWTKNRMATEGTTTATNEWQTMVDELRTYSATASNDDAMMWATANRQRKLSPSRGFGLAGACARCACQHPAISLRNTTSMARLVWQANHLRGARQTPLEGASFGKSKHLSWKQWADFLDLSVGVNRSANSSSPNTASRHQSNSIYRDAPSHRPCGGGQR